MVWALASLWIALPWIRDLGGSVTVPVAAPASRSFRATSTPISWRASVLDRPKPVEDELPAPSVTVLIGAYNESHRIADTVRDALASDYRGHVTVMVCADGSSDGTAAIVAALAADDARVRLVSCSHGGKASALNHGLASVDTPLIATCDADTLVVPWALRRAPAGWRRARPTRSASPSRSWCATVGRIFSLRCSRGITCSAPPR
jgi:hypothetical protein